MKGIIHAVVLMLIVYDARAYQVVRNKRADDPSPEQAVLDQLTQRVNQLTAEVAALKAQARK
jgi:peptidoglycan hydrolase CwlO-like protein